MSYRSQKFEHQNLHPVTQRGLKYRMRVIQTPFMNQLEFFFSPVVPE